MMVVAPFPLFLVGTGAVAMCVAGRLIPSNGGGSTLALARVRLLVGGWALKELVRGQAFLLLQLGVVVAVRAVLVSHGWRRRDVLWEVVQLCSAEKVGEVWLRSDRCEVLIGENNHNILIKVGGEAVTVAPPATAAALLPAFRGWLDRRHAVVVSFRFGALDGGGRIGWIVGVHIAAKVVSPKPLAQHSLGGLVELMDEVQVAVYPLSPLALPDVVVDTHTYKRDADNNKQNSNGDEGRRARAGGGVGFGPNVTLIAAAPWCTVDNGGGWGGCGCCGNEGC